MTAALEDGEWSAARPGRALPPGKTRYPFYRRLGGPQGRSGRTENLVPNWDSIPDRPARGSVAIPTELSGSQIKMYHLQISHEIIFLGMGNNPFFPYHLKYITVQTFQNCTKTLTTTFSYNVCTECYLHLRIPHGLYVRNPDDRGK